MMDLEPISGPPVDFENHEIDWERVVLDDELSPTFFRFLTPDLETARRLCLEMMKNIELGGRSLVQSNGEDVLRQLREPGLKPDLRMDGYDLSYSEIRREEGDIEATFYLRNMSDNRDYQTALSLGVDKTMELAAKVSRRE